MSDFKNIYGVSSSLNGACMCVVSPSIQATLLKFVELIETMKTSIEQYFPTVNMSLSLRGNMNLSLKVPGFIMVRLLWKDKYPGLPMDKNNYFYRSTIRDYYFQLGRHTEWDADPLSKIT